MAATGLLVGGRLADRERIDAARLRSFLTTLTPICFGFGIAMAAISFLASRDHRIALSGWIVFSHGFCAVYSRRQALRGRPVRALRVTCLSLYSAVLTLAFILPGIYPVLAIVPLFTIAVTLPYRRGRDLRWMPALGFLVSVGSATLGVTLPHPAIAPPWFVPAMNVSGVAAAVSLLLLLLLQFSARLREDLAALETSQRTAQFLAEVSGALSQSLDSRATLTRVAELAVPGLADWCLIDVVDGDGSLRRVAAVYAGDAPPREDDAPPPELAPPPLARAALHSGQLERRRTGVPAHGEVALPLVAAGRVVGALTLGAAARDVVPHEEVAALIHSLGGRIALAIENARLYQEAQQAIRTREDFLFVAGHELRTPLAALQLQVQALKRVGLRAELLDARFVAGLERADRSVARLTTLVTELLNVSRISAGKLELQLEEVDLAALTCEVAERFIEQVRAARTQLSVDAGERVAGRWDRLRLDEVITNLLSNALKYGDGKPIDISVRMTGAAAIVVMRDRGIGIALDRQAHIFGRFERAVSERNYGGLGLGLWIVQQIVDAHGGVIRFESEPGKGTTFYVELPLGGPASAAAPAVVAATASAASGATAARGAVSAE